MQHDVTRYADNDDVVGLYKVTFIVNETNERLTRGFDSPYHAKDFVRKLKHSKRCTLLSAPIFY